MRLIAVFTLSLIAAFAPALVGIAFAGEDLAGPAELRSALYTLAITIVSSITAFVIAVRPLIQARVADLFASTAAKQREVVEGAIAAAIELHPNRFEDAAAYVRATVPDALSALGVNDEMLPRIIEARKLRADAERYK